MSIKYKHCCILNDKDFIECEQTIIENEDKELEAIKITTYDSSLESQGIFELFLDRKTAVRLAKSLRTEINKIPNEFDTRKGGSRG